MSLESSYQEETSPEDLQKILVELGCTAKEESNTEFVSPRNIEWSSFFQLLDDNNLYPEMGTGSNDDKIYIQNTIIVKHPEASDNRPEHEKILGQVARVLELFGCKKSEIGRNVYILENANPQWILSFFLHETSTTSDIEMKAMVSYAEEIGAYYCLEEIPVDLTVDLIGKDANPFLVIKYNQKIILTVFASETEVQKSLQKANKNKRLQERRQAQENIKRVIEERWAKRSEKEYQDIERLPIGAWVSLYSNTTSTVEGLVTDNINGNITLHTGGNELLPLNKSKMVTIPIAEAIIVPNESRFGANPQRN